jgi:predicted nucleic acid-binding protein
VAYLLDTTILVRLANASDAQHADAVGAVLEMHRHGELLHVTPQVLIEFRNVATRPAAANGLGLSTADAEAQAATLEARFPLLPDTPDIYPAWKALVSALAITGKQVHDARLVAACHAHEITHLLTFNVSHFVRMAAFGPGLVVVDPAGEKRCQEPFR